MLQVQGRIDALSTWICRSKQGRDLADARYRPPTFSCAMSLLCQEPLMRVEPRSIKVNAEETRARTSRPTALAMELWPAICNKHFSEGPISRPAATQRVSARILYYY